MCACGAGSRHEVECGGGAAPATAKSAFGRRMAPILYKSFFRDCLRRPLKVIRKMARSDLMCNVILSEMSSTLYGDVVEIACLIGLPWRGLDHDLLQALLVSQTSDIDCNASCLCRRIS